MMTTKTAVNARYRVCFTSATADEPRRVTTGTSRREPYPATRGLAMNRTGDAR